MPAEQSPPVPADVTAPAELLAVLQVAGALERPILAGAPAAELFGILAAVFAAQLWPGLPEELERVRRQAEVLMRARSRTPADTNPVVPPAAEDWRPGMYL